MTIETFLRQASAALDQAGISSARLDTLILLEDALGHDRAWILAHPEIEIDHATGVALNTKIEQRISQTPLAYIRGHAPFYGREFMVNEHVLVPRPETEAAISLFKGIALPQTPRIVDVGTGTGCIGITVALEQPGAQVTLIDSDLQALAVAEQNVQKLGAQGVTLVKSDLLADLKTPTDVVFANLPYVPTAHHINAAAQHEPGHAIFSGVDGLDHFRRLWQQIAALPEPPRYVITESLEDQQQALEQLAVQAGYHLAVSEGLAQRFER